MLKIEEDWGGAGGVDDRFCYLCVCVTVSLVSHCVRWFTPIPDCPPFEVKPPAAALELWRLRKRDTSLHGQRIHMSSVAISPPVRYLESSPGRTDSQIICAGHISSERGIACPTWGSDSIISFHNSSFLIFWFKTFESMVAVLSPNLRLWETFDRIYCQVLHINCPTHRLPCHSLQSTNITCETRS